MANYGTYASLNDIRTALGYGASDTTDDTRLLAVLEAVSRFIDDAEGCNRHFNVVTATRTFTAEFSNKLLLPYDLLSITTLKTDDDGDWDYDNTWATTDYHLYPFNEFPKWKIITKSGGDYSFPRQEEGVQIVGPWGYGNGESAAPYTADTTTAEELDATETGIDVTSGTNIYAGHTLLVESEQMYVQSKSTNTLTVVRGVNGTTAATHATAKQVYIYQYPQPVKEACTRLAQKLFRAKDAPYGVVGMSEMGTTYIGKFMDVIIAGMLGSYRRISVA